MIKTKKLLSIVLILSLVGVQLVLAGCNANKESSAGKEKKVAERLAKNSSGKDSNNEKEITVQDESSAQEDNSSERTKEKTSNETEKKGSKKTVKKVDKKLTEKPAAQKKEKGKTWVPPVTKKVYHPAKTRRYIAYYTCQCGRTFPSKIKYQEHRPVPCNGKHTYAEPTWAEKIIEEAWTETIVVKEGYWK